MVLAAEKRPSAWLGKIARVLSLGKDAVGGQKVFGELNGVCYPDGRASLEAAAMSLTSLW
jgi:hypothetical protein